MTSPPQDNKPPRLEYYFRIALSTLIVASSLAGLVFFYYAFAIQHTSIWVAVESFVPTLIFFGLLIGSNFFDIMQVHDLQTWLFVLLLAFSFFFLLPAAIMEKDSVRQGYWFSAFTGVLGFATGIPIGGRLGRRK
jgi:Ni,Fe-hydrogenase I cytochrome b subunit